MTLEEKRAERDKLLKALAQPESLQSGSKAIRQRGVQEILSAIAKYDAEIAAEEGTSTQRAFLTSFSRAE